MQCHICVPGSAVIPCYLAPWPSAVIWCYRAICTFASYDLLLSKLLSNLHICPSAHFCVLTAAHATEQSVHSCPTSCGSGSDSDQLALVSYIRVFLCYWAIYTFMSYPAICDYLCYVAHLCPTICNYLPMYAAEHIGYIGLIDGTNHCANGNLPHHLFFHWTACFFFLVLFSSCLTWWHFLTLC